MALDEANVAALRAQGYGFVCSMCEKMHEGQRLGIVGCTGQDCRGPLAGSDFREYQGPLTPAMMADGCFVCGDPAVIRLKPTVNPLARRLGICEKHKPMLGHSRFVKRTDAPAT